MSRNQFNHARLLLCAHTLEQCPPDNGIEVAFAGYSNTGKSSVINAITGNRGLARISKSPGRTRQLIFFNLDMHNRLVDLPGYGYARVPAQVKRDWEEILEKYLRKPAILMWTDADHGYPPSPQTL
jgi:ribosome biogenesis GTP-binding protein YsxC/EngB